MTSPAIGGSLRGVSINRKQHHGYGRVWRRLNSVSQKRPENLACVWKLRDENIMEELISEKKKKMKNRNSKIYCRTLRLGLQRGQEQKHLEVLPKFISVGKKGV